MKQTNQQESYIKLFANCIAEPSGIDAGDAKMIANKINEIVCKTKIALTNSQISTIKDYKNGNVSATISTTGTDNGTTSNTTTPEIGKSNATNTDKTAAASVSFTRKIWNFVKGIFGR